MCDGDGREAYERRVKRDCRQGSSGHEAEGARQGGRSELEGSSLFHSRETLTPSSARISLEIGFLPRVLTAVRATSRTEGGAHASEGG